MRPTHPSNTTSNGKSRLGVIGLLVVMIAVGIGAYWWYMEKPSVPMEQVRGTEGKAVSTPPITQTSKTSLIPPQNKGVMVSPEKQQMIGVKTEPATIRDLTHTIRTVGQVEVDERRLTHMHTKLEGWVQELYVKFTGEHVKKDQKLFEIYSPELVSTQEEYLLALKAVQSLGDSEFPEVAQNARSLLEVTRQRFSLWDITPDHIRDLEKTGKVLRTLPLHAPSSGYVMHMAVREGMHVMPAMELYALADLSTVWVLADVYEYEIPLVELGQQATMTLSYFPGQTFKGKVTYVYPTLETKTRTVKVRVELPNPQWALKPGMFANIDLQIPRGKRLVVPITAVLDSGTEQLVFIDQGQSMFEPRKVTVGVRTRDAYEILEGITAGELVVTRGNFLVDSESNLKTATEMMMPGMDMGKKSNVEQTAPMTDMQP
ncbi:MAG: efflux RND transporter periplasmic adaptor subunit [Nitrospirales bacterium]|nr:efflux RND transporter periplasmic adaptor subunit [Nitrospirales bacterium]